MAAPGLRWQQAWHALANYCANDLGELHATAGHKPKRARKRPSDIAACWMQATHLVMS